MGMYMKTNIKRGRSTDMRCPNTECERIIAGEDFQRLLQRKDLLQYQDFMLNDNLRRDTNVCWCPKKKCGIPMIKESGCPMLKCPNCNYLFCANCKVDWHADITCEKYQAWKKE